MRLIILLLLLIISPFLSLSQAPQGFNYQAIVRDASGNVRANEGVQFQFRIQDLAGNAVYTENHTVVTNKYGLADGIIIGKGSTVDDFTSVDWGNGTYYINVKVDGVDLGTSQLLSVPYALYALNAGSGSSGADGVGIQSTVDNGDGTGHKIVTARVEKRAHQFLYKDSSGYHFMDTSTYEQLSLEESQKELLIYNLLNHF